MVVDFFSRILSIITGFKGNNGDSRVLRSSTLYADMEEGRLLNSPPLHLKGISVPQYLVGDSGYPLLPWLMVPYTDPMVTSCQEDFDSKHYLMQQAALRALSCLRKWGILSKPIEEDVRVVVACIGACAILHNRLLAREGGSTILEGTEDYALHDESSQYYRDANMVEYCVEKKASVIRNALAAKARCNSVLFRQPQSRWGLGGLHQTGKLGILIAIFFRARHANPSAPGRCRTI